MQLSFALLFFSKMGNSASDCHVANHQNCAPFTNGCESAKGELSRRFDKVLAQHSDCDAERTMFRDDWIQCTKDRVALEQKCATPLAGETHNSKVLAAVSSAISILGGICNISF